MKISDASYSLQCDIRCTGNTTSIPKMKKEFIKKGVGVLIYVKSELNPTDRTDFENSSFKECKWVDIHVENEKNIDRCLLLGITN